MNQLIASIVSTLIVLVSIVLTLIYLIRKKKISLSLKGFLFGLCLYLVLKLIVVSSVMQVVDNVLSDNMLLKQIINIILNASCLVSVHIILIKFFYKNNSLTKQDALGFGVGYLAIDIYSVLNNVAGAVIIYWKMQHGDINEYLMNLYSSYEESVAIASTHYAIEFYKTMDVLQLLYTGIVVIPLILLEYYILSINFENNKNMLTNCLAVGLALVFYIIGTIGTNASFLLAIIAYILLSILIIILEKRRNKNEN